MLRVINDSSISLSGTNFGFTTFSVAAIKLKPSLVFCIFVKQGRQTLSESEAFFFPTTIPVFAVRVPKLFNRVVSCSMG